MFVCGCVCVDDCVLACVIACMRAFEIELVQISAL